MKLLDLIFVAFTLLFSQLSITQENEKLQNINGKLNLYTATQSPEKAYLHTDKDIYLNGETVWYKAYLVDGINHNISDKSKVIYIELIDNQDSIIVQQKLFLENIGVAGNIDLPETINVGNYRLRAYSKYMLNENEPVIFSKKITVWGSENKISEQNFKLKKNEETPNTKVENDLIADFFPEGGTLVFGVENTLGIKITNHQGNEISTFGKIIDQNNTLIKDFETFEFGLGKVSYLPEKGNTYYASITIDGQEKKYSLPTPEDKGYVLNVVQTTGHITIKATTTINNGLKGSLLVGHIRGRTFLSHSKESNESSYLIKIPMESMVDGVAHFTLFTSTGEPVCERLVFINDLNNDYNLKIETSLPSYQKQQKVDVALILENMQGKEPSGNFSASVINNSANSGNLVQNIESWLLLNSDLGGTIENAGFFFEENSAKKRFLLDALMLTHGWRRFVWKEILNEKVSKNLVYEPEKGIMITGQTTAFKNKYQPKASLVKLELLNTDFYEETKATDIRGNFSFGPFFFQDSIPTIIKTEPISSVKNKSENDFTIQVNKIHPIISQKTRVKSESNSIQYIYPKDYITSLKQKTIVDFKLDPNVIKLDEVVVAKNQKTPKEILNEKINNRVYYSEPTIRIFADSVIGGAASYNRDVFDILRVNGFLGFRNVQVMIDSANLSNNLPTFLLDGSPVTIDILTSINPFEISFIDILNGPEAAAYNSPKGVLAVYTKTYTRYLVGFTYENVQKPSPNIANVTLKGFHKTREFYSPRYDVPKEEHNQQDFRSTLQWQPDIIMNEQGAPNLNFYTGDVSGIYKIHVEGITADGIPVSASQFFEVED